MKAQLPKLLLLLAVLAALGLSAIQTRIDPYYFQIIIFIGINITLATSLNLINGFTGQFSLGHAGFMAVGGYTAALITTLPMLQPLGAWLYPAAILGAGIAAAVFSLLVGIPSLRLRGDYLAITTLGFGEIIRVVIQNLDFLGGARGFTGIPQYSNAFWVFGVMSLTIYAIYALIHSTYGKGFLAVRDDEIAAQAMGISTTRYKVIAFLTGAFFAGIAGALYAGAVCFITPTQFGFMKSIEIVAMVIIGGMGNTVGVILAAILLTILPELLRPIAEYRMIIYSLMLIIIMILRPQGLFSRRNTPS